MGEENSAQVPVEHKLLLEVMFERGVLFGYPPFRRLSSPIQGVPIRWGFKATNIGKSSFPGAAVKEMKISLLPLGSGSPFVNSDEDFSIPPLNPRASDEHWFDGSVVLNFDRGAWVSCKLEPPNSSHRIATFQGVDVRFQAPNEWGKSVFIEQKLTRTQATTNQLLLALTALTALEGFIGLKAIGTWVLNGVRAFLRWLLDIIS